MSIFYVDGTYVPAEQAVIPASDLAVLRGFGAFDFLRTYGGRPFRLRQNVERLRHSCALIGLHYDWSDDAIYDIVMETLSRQPANATGEYNIRLVVTGGSSPDNITPAGQPRLMVMITPLHELPAEWYTDGVKVVTVEMARLVPGAKSINYIPAIMAQAIAREQGGIEALYLTADGHVTEGTTTNVFAFYGDEMVTPDTGILPGITRRTVLELADGVFKTTIRDMLRDDLYRADEVFITAANKQIVPVVQIDDRRISTAPGPNTRRIMALFKAETERVAAQA